MSTMSGRWTRVRTLGRGASGAEVFLAVDRHSGTLFVVKFAAAPAGGAELLRRERRVMLGLCSPHVVTCIGGSGGRDGSYSLFLEFAPSGSLADAVAAWSISCGGHGLDERIVAAYAADVATGLAYVHDAGLVHGDVKPQNVVIGRNGHAKLADFGCTRSAVEHGGPVGGTPAYMAPEVARGDAQGQPADVWVLGCTVLELATGRAPWCGVVDNVVTAVRLVGYTDAVPDVPGWLSADAKDFLGRCLQRCPDDRATSQELLAHPFIASTAGSSTADCRAAGLYLHDDEATCGSRCLSPEKTLDAPFFACESDGDSDDDDDDDVVWVQNAVARIRALACTASPLPDWDSEDGGWIDLLSARAQEWFWRSPKEKTTKNSVESPMWTD